MKLESLLPSVQKMPLKHPVSGEETGIEFNLVGQDSKPFRDKARAISKGMIGKKTQDLDPIAIEAESFELVAACIVGWNDEEAFGPYTPSKAVELMKMDELAFAREQIEEFVKLRANFFRKLGEAA